ncbi:unnamed protein product [Hymenolepis diminuta]|uniref:Integrase catalytic domain-containing protein n=1 Tax=Hymenolepis diminuta TaxID=6216 RepID=A0A564YIJ6_HYMDI|nr:unnamed protein product [Hymenolepis diminuta]
MPLKNTSATIRALDHIFTKYGFSETLVSDKRTQFCSLQFEKYCRRRTIDYTHNQKVKVRGEGATEEFIRKFLLTNKTTPNPILGGKLSVELLFGRTVRTISHFVIPNNRTNKPRKCLKIGVFTTGDLVLVRDFRIGHSWTSETGLKRRGNVTYDIRVNDIIWIRNRNQLRPRIAETGSTSASNSLYLLIDTFKLPANKSDKAHERTSEQQISCSKWARQKLSRLRMISKLWSY